MWGSCLVIVIIVDILALAGDISQTWTSPIFPILYSNDTSVNPIGRPITKTEDSWIGSLVNIGAVLGAIPSGLIADKIGRRFALLAIALPHFTAYLMYAFSKKVYLFYIGRVINGFALGAGYTILPMYIAEITDDNNRGLLSVTLNIFWTLGNCLPLGIGPFLPIKTFNLLIAAFPCIFLILFLIVGTETPYYLVHKGKNNEAIKVLVKLRRCSEDTAKMELVKIEETFKMHEDGTLMDIFSNRGLRKALIISLILISLQQLGGVNVLSYYMQLIFQTANLSFPVEISTTVCGAWIFISSFTAIFVIEKLGRKLPLIISGLGNGLSLCALGAFFYIHDSRTIDTKSLSWLPTVAVLCFIFFFNFGFAAIPWTITSELFPNKVKAVSAAAVAATCWICSFIVTLTFNNLQAVLNTAGSFWVYASFGLVAAIFILIFVPETKGKSFKEIQEMLQK